MVAICHGCHRKVEFTKKLTKRSLFAAGFAYKKLMRQKLGLSKKSKRAKKSFKPRCKCGNMRRHNRLKCRACEPNGKIVTYRGNKHLTDKP